MTRSTVVRPIVTLLAAAAAAVVLSAQDASDAPPAVAILAPSPTEYLSGPVLLRAGIEPAGAAAQATFFVDGRQVCVLVEAPFYCEWDAGRDAVARQVRLVVDLAAGGRVVRTLRTRSLNFVEKVDVDAVQVTVLVSDDQGRFVNGLPASAFRVHEDGTRQAIVNFASNADDSPLELVVAVDISVSMTAEMPRLRTAVKEFLGAISPRDQVTLLGFNDTVFTLARRSTDPAQRMRVVDRLAPWGGTALYDVIVRGTDMLGLQGGRKALVVFTDGEDHGSRVSLEDAERRLQSSDVMLYLIAHGRGVTEERPRNVMHRLVTPTGGRVFATTGIDALEDAFALLLEELANQYLLGYQPTNTLRNDTWREIKVDVDGYTNVRARLGYRALPMR
jgi:Ca-activated chloride channel family protein